MTVSSESGGYWLVQSVAGVYWAAVHGLVELTRTGRVPAQDTARRIEVLVERFADE